MSDESDGPKREQSLVFGEIAEQYDAFRPTYPDELFDAILEYGALGAGDAALEIGAGTGKATTGFVNRGLAVHAIEPSPEMARVLAAKGVPVEVTTFGEWPLQPEAFGLVYAAQSWHWVQNTDRYEKAAAALAPGGTLALFWNVGRSHPEPFRTDNDAAYARLAPQLTSSVRARAEADQFVSDAEAGGAFEPIVERMFTWETTYSSTEWMRLLETHSDHRMLPDDVRTELHAEIGACIDAHGGRLPVVYDTKLYLARRV